MGSLSDAPDDSSHAVASPPHLVVFTSATPVPLHNHLAITYRRDGCRGVFRPRLVGNPPHRPSHVAYDQHAESWRVRDRMKTVSVGLVLCLNVGVDPPDVVKPDPCARLECWQDPTTMPQSTVNDAMTKALQLQYERWQPRARYKNSADPTTDEVRKLCINLRRLAKDERVLFHYNGHGVPKPTANGEIWVFNKSYTQYIPLSIYELQSWVGAPSIFVFDCSAAGLIVANFKKSLSGRRQDLENGTLPPSDDAPATHDCILLAACRESELLPTNPDLPADLFTSCLTTPIKMALRWFAPRSLVENITPEMLDSIPGRLNDRKTPLGELNWIFTAITDTIAWNALPRKLFKRLFRQDLLVASLFRNFLLAERILWSCGCTPISEPALPATHDHPLWQSWDYTVEHCLAQLPAILSAGPTASFRAKDFQYTNNPFFEDQMTAFEVWLAAGPQQRNPPEQLPIVLQVLLSQAHRLRALKLLARFLQMGGWAIELALSVGIFPYVLKLLQAKDLQQELIFIWGKILAIDKSCESDLLKEEGHCYFAAFLAAGEGPPVYLSMAAFVLSMVAVAAPEKCVEENVVQTCLARIHCRKSAPLVQRWSLLCLSRLLSVSVSVFLDWVREPQGANVHDVCHIAGTSPAPDVRGAACNLLGVVLNHSLNYLLDPNREETAARLRIPANDWSMCVDGEILSMATKIAETFVSVLKTDFCSLIRREVASIFGYTITTHKDCISEIGRNCIVPGTAQAILMTALVAVGQLAKSTHPVVRGTAILHFSEFQLPEATGGPILDDDVEAPAPAWDWSWFLANLAPQTEKEMDLRRGETPFSRLNSEQEACSLAQAALSFFEWSAEEIIRLKCDGGTAVDAARKNGHLGPPGAEESIPEPFSGNRDFFSCLNQFADEHASPYLKEHANIEWASSASEKLSFRTNGGDLLASRFFRREPLLATGDNRGVVTIWDYESGSQEMTLGIPTSQKVSPAITSLELISQGDSMTILVANRQARLAVWTRSALGEYTLAAGWTASDLERNASRQMLLIGLNSRDNQFLTGGCENGIVRLWDLSTEMCVLGRKISDSLVTAISTTSADAAYNGPGTQDASYVGTQDGSFWIVDKRETSSRRRCKGHNSAILAVTTGDCCRPDHTVMSFAEDGSINVWDLRASEVPCQSVAIASGISAASAAPLGSGFAVGSHLPSLEIYGQDCKRRLQLQHRDGFLGTRFQPITNITWHPIKNMIAACFEEAVVSIVQ